MTGVDPISLAASATHFGIGALQSVFGRNTAKKAERELENLKTPTYTGNKAISDYYKTALSRYNVSPFESAAYRQTQQQVGRNFNAGLSALGDRRSALAGVGGLVAASNNAMQNAGVVAENNQNTRFAQLGSASQMQAADDRMKFETNQMLPFQKTSSLLAMKAGAGNSRANAGISNMFAGLSNATSILANRGDATALGVPVVSGSPEWQRIMTEYTGRTGRRSWDTQGALNDFKIPR